jgi:hypothetical protein
MAGQAIRKKMLPQVRKIGMGKCDKKSRLYMFVAPAWLGRPHMKMILPQVRNSVLKLF